MRIDDEVVMSKESIHWDSLFLWCFSETLALLVAKNVKFYSF